jgi:hypothetical protein
MDLDELTNRELLGVWASSLRLLYERGIVRTHNNPIGDIAEEMVARHCTGVRGSFDQAAWDIRVGDGLLQVKACRRATPTSKVGFSPIRHEDGYTAVILVVFGPDMTVQEAWRVPREVVNEVGIFSAHVNGIKDRTDRGAAAERRGRTSRTDRRHTGLDSPRSHPLDLPPSRPAIGERRVTCEEPSVVR